MTTIITRETGATAKGSPLTNAEVDNNFINLNKEVTPSRPSKKPILNLDFANSETVDKRITFYRSTKASYYDKDGVLRYALPNQPRIEYNPSTKECKGLLVEDTRANLYKYDISFAAGAYFLAPICNSDKAPDGTYSATLYIPTRESNAHRIEVRHTTEANQPYTHSIYVKSAGYTSIKFFTFPDGSAYTSGTDQTVYFDLVTGTYYSIGANISKLSITPVNNGWYRCSVTVYSNQASTSGYVGWQIQPDISNVSTYSGNGTSGMLMWGCQIEKALSLTNYIPPQPNSINPVRNTTATYVDKNGLIKTAGPNQPRFSYKYTSTGVAEYAGLLTEGASTNLVYADLNNPASTYSLTYCGLGFSSAVKAPDGVSQAHVLTVNTAGIWAWISQGHTVTTNTTYTHSVFVKKGSVDTVICNLWSSAAGLEDVGVMFTFSTENISIFGNTSNILAYKFEKYPNGWYRLIYVVKTTGAGYLGLQSIRLQPPSGTLSVGDYVYYWGPQFEVGGWASSYIPTYGAATTRSADTYNYAEVTRSADYFYLSNKPIFDYNITGCSGYIEYTPIGTTYAWNEGYIYMPPAVRFDVNSNGTAELYAFSNSTVYGAPGYLGAKTAYAYSPTHLSIARSGVLVSDTNLTDGHSSFRSDFDSIRIVGTISAYIKQLCIYNSLLSGNELVGLTK